MADSPALDLRFQDAPGPDAFLRERVYAVLDDFQPAAIHEDESGDVWRVFFRSSELRDAARTHLSAVVAPTLLRTSAVDVADGDWARRSQEGLRAIAVGNLIIAPPWDVPGQGGTSSANPAPVILIEPSMGFGTGHHATTRLCLRLLQRLELRGARVIDVGTGSGVLALAAWKLGATDVVGVDNDADALENARSNIARNGAATAIDIVRDDLAQLRLAPASVLLANLTAAVLLKHPDTLRSLVVPGGHLILSGFAPAHLVEIEPREDAPFEGLRHVRHEVEGDWAAVCLQVPSS